ncbi:MAG: FKBP-type peptidyl-prolyl cis-trans isomerase [Bacteroidota bacterium]
MSTPITIEDHRIVTVSYEVRDGGPSGPLLERMDANYPFKFMFGVGQMLPAWERQLFGLKVGMGFTFTLPPEMAYGLPRTDHVLDMPKHLFANEADQIAPDLLQEGQFITLTDADGKAMNGKILSWNEDTVKVDCNHALAGKTLFFSGAILNIREATVDELIRKQYIEQGGVRS